MLSVCSKCSRLGFQVTKGQLKATSSRGNSSQRVLEAPKPELTLRVDYAKVVKAARERLRLRQDELGALVGEKASVISLIERGKLRPSFELSRRLERILKVQLLEEL
jgi:putative transcription factor